MLNGTKWSEASGPGVRVNLDSRGDLQTVGRILRFAQDDKELRNKLAGSQNGKML
jgi:hypothetical protein